MHVVFGSLTISDSQVTFKEISKASSYRNGEDELRKFSLEGTGTQNKDLERGWRWQDGRNHHREDSILAVPAANCLEPMFRKLASEEHFTSFSSNRIKEQTSQDGAQSGHAAIVGHFLRVL